MMIVWWILIKITIFFFHFHGFYCANTHTHTQFCTKDHFGNGSADMTQQQKGKLFRSLHSATSKYIVVGRDKLWRKKTERNALFRWHFQRIIVLFCIWSLFSLSFAHSPEAFICMGCVQLLYCYWWCKNARKILQEKIYLCVRHRRNHQVKCEINTFHTKRTHARTKHFVGACARACWYICGKVIKRNDFLTEKC